jgi:hypothetical protein
MERINKIHQLVSSGKTGTPSQLAQKLRMSESHLYTIVDDLRQEKVPIAYSRKLGTYYYERPFKMEASLLLKELGEEELKNISGGFVHSDFLVVAKCSFAPSMAIGAGDGTNLPKKELVLF